MKEGNVLFNDAVNTFYLRFYDVGHMINNWDKLLTYILVQVIGKYRDFVCVCHLGPIVPTIGTLQPRSAVQNVPVSYLFARYTCGAR